MKKIIALVLALVMVLGAVACTATTTTTTTTTTETTTATETSTETEAAAEPAAVMSYAEYAAADLDTEVTVVCYVQAKQSWWDNKVTVYAADQDGAYFLYNMACSEEDFANLVGGTKIQVTGYKSEWSGEVEITDATFTFVDDGDTYLSDAKDVTDLLGTDGLIDLQNQRVAFTGMVVEPSTDANGNEAAFLYNWDGSGTHDDNSDLYFNVSYNGATYQFCVESYLCDNQTDVYAAVEALNIGDTVDMEGFLYWYNGVNPHITSVTVTAAAENTASYAGYAFDMKNKTGKAISELYIYPAGCEGADCGNNLLATEWPDKDTDGDLYEFLAYIVRPASTSFTVVVTYADGTTADATFTDITTNFKISLKDADPTGWECEAVDDGEDLDAMKLLADAGYTTDTYYPGYSVLAYEIKNKTELNIVDFRIYEDGGDYNAYPNMIDYLYDEDGNKVDLWLAGKGGVYVFDWFLRPTADGYSVRIVYEDGTELIAENLDLLGATGDGNAYNELSMKDGADPDLWKIDWDDDPVVSEDLAAKVADGTPMDLWVPAF